MAFTLWKGYPILHRAVPPPPVGEVSDPLRVFLQPFEPVVFLGRGDALILLDRVDRVVMLDDLFRVPLDPVMRGQEVGRRDDPALVVDHDEGAAPAIGGR